MRLGSLLRIVSTILRIRRSRRVGRSPGSQVSLPVELYRQIAEELALSKRDLASLLRVSRAFHHEAEPLLYCAIEIIDGGLNHRVERLLHLADNLRLASHVRSLRIAAPGYQHNSAYRYLIAVNRALGSVCNLLHLRLEMFATAEDGARYYPPFYLLSSCSFQLKTLEVDGLREVDIMALRDQGQLKELRIVSTKDAVDFTEVPFKTLERVAVLENRPSVITQFLSKGMVHAISLPAASLKLCLADSPFQNITALYLTECATHTFLDVTVYFLSLRYLRLELERLAAIYFPHIVDSLKKSPTLEKLQVVGRARGGYPVYEDLSELLVSGHLDTLTLQIGARRYMRWNVDSSDGVPVEDDSTEWKQPGWGPRWGTA